MDGALDLSRRLAASGDVQRCAVRRLYEFLRARPATADDAGVLRDLEGRFKAQNFSLKALLLEIVSKPAVLASGRSG